MSKRDSIETRHYAERDALFAGLRRLSRRSFLKVAGLSAGIAAARSLIPPHGFQLVEVADAADRPFTFAYISDTHLYSRRVNDRFVRAILKAVDDVNNLDPQPDFVQLREGRAWMEAGEIEGLLPAEDALEPFLPEGAEEDWRDLDQEPLEVLTDAEWLDRAGRGKEAAEKKAGGKE